MHLKEERDEVDRVKKEDLSARRKFKKVFDIHRETIDKENFLAKIFSPLHRQLQNLYR
jgi:hypothetical protein